MNDKTRKQMLSLIEGSAAEHDPDGRIEDARDTLNNAVEDFVEQWDEFARERWHETNVGDRSPDHVVLNRRVAGDSDVQDLPEFDEFRKVADSVAKDMLEALQTVRRAEEQASNAYFMARRRLVEAARRLPGMNKRRHSSTFKDEY